MVTTNKLPGDNYVRKVRASSLCLQSFARSYYSFYAIWDSQPELDHGSGDLFPFKSVCNALLGDAAISWCKVFGADSEPTHWKSVVKDIDIFRDWFYSRLEVDRDEFGKYRESMKGFRDNVISHFNADHFESGTCPEFKLALEASTLAHTYFRGTVQPGSKFMGPSDLKVYGKDVGRWVSGRLCP